MKKRLRKKKHRKEFTEYGIEFDLKVTSEVSELDFDDLIDRFITDFVEEYDLYCGGGWQPRDRTCGMIIEPFRSMDQANELAEPLKKWFESQGVKFEWTHKIVNLWYPDEQVDDCTTLILHQKTY